MKNNSNKSNMFNESVLQVFIESVISEEVIGEEETGGGGTNPLANTFIKPFTDVVKTAAYGIERLSAQVQTVVQGFLYGLPTLFVPFLEYDYEAFRKEEWEEIEAIKKKYEKTLQANLDAVSSNDAFGVAFLLAPTKVLATQLAFKAPVAAIKVLDIFTGGHGIFGGVASVLQDPASIGFHDPGGHSAGSWSGGGGGGWDSSYGADDGISEARQPVDRKASEKAMKILKNTKVQALIQKSPVAKQMRKDGVKVIVDHVRTFLGLQDYNQMRKMAKGDVGFSQIGQKLAQMNQSGQIPAKDNPIVTAAMVPKLKQAYKEFWIKQLQQLTKQYPEANDELLDGIKLIQSIPS